ncbi:MAG: alpha/beta hydrolase [Firmicutes bacterium]|nr:alpha/beta hydrolase [Bacillota bacterium]
MITDKKNLWENTPGICDEIPTITSYIPENKKSDAAIVIFPGGGYAIRAAHEGQGYAEFLAENGLCAFVVDYRVAPHKFPLPLLDARRGVRTVRYYAEKYGIDKNKIAVMGSSAGGNLAAITSTYYDKIDFEGADEIDKEDFIPNAQILCYPVIDLIGEYAHIGSTENLLGDRIDEMAEKLSPAIIAKKGTPQTFIWHTFADDCVNVNNTIKYIKKLKEIGTDTECHIFSKGGHGLGLAPGDDDVSKNVAQWGGLLLKWLKFIGF